MNNDDHKVIIKDDEKSLVLDHDYDGIHELNHPLPNWWVGIWALSIIFSVPYFLYLHVMDGEGIRATYEKEVAIVKKQKAERMAQTLQFDTQAYSTWVTANDGVQKGEAIFNENCVSCHAEGGGGDIGPNLTDKYWINAKDRVPEELYPIIFEGRKNGEMPPWGDVLSREDLYAVISYVISLKGTTPPKAKEPQGELIESE